MRDATDFLPWIRPFAQSVPEPVAVRNIIDAADEFCKRTRCWREVEVVSSDGIDFEVLCVPPGAALYEVEEAHFNGCELERVSFNDIPPELIPQIVDGPQKPGELGEPRYISSRGANAVVIAPPAAGMLRISMFLVPAPGADMLPDVLFDSFSKDVGAGALARILILPDQPFTNPDMAMMFASQFERACDRNFRYNKRGQQRAATRTSASWF